MRNAKKKRDYLTVKEVADLFDISERSVNRYIIGKKIRATKIGGWRISKKDLQDFIKRSSNI